MVKTIYLYIYKKRLIVLLDKTLIPWPGLCRALGSCIETAIWTFNPLALIEVHYMEKNLGMFPQKPLIPIFFFFVINYFFFFTHNNIISKIQQNKTTDTYSTSQGQSKGRGRGKINKNTKVTPLYNHVCPTKNTAKHQWSRAWPHQPRAVVHSHDTICRRLRIQYVFLHVWCKPVLDYCLLHSCKTSKQHYLLH